MKLLIHKNQEEKRAIFLDRDGTINEDIGYLYNIKNIRFIPGAIKALRLLQTVFLLFIITNQDGIGKGIFSESDFLKFNEEYKNILKRKGIKIQETFYCPHTKDDNCICRKPKSYFIDMAKEKYDLNLTESYIIGDHPSDVETGIRAQMKSVFLQTGHGKKHMKEIKNKTVFLVSEDIYSAAISILDKVNK